MARRQLTHPSRKRYRTPILTYLADQASNRAETAQTPRIRRCGRDFAGRLEAGAQFPQGRDCSGSRGHVGGWVIPARGVQRSLPTGPIRGARSIAAVLRMGPRTVGLRALG